MENLNKNQLILLVLLITFVTSIATGIMTFSLLQQAPLEVTRTINQVVEKTIQQVTPATNILSPSQKEVTTVVVKEEDLVLDSINKNLKSIVRIQEKDGAGNIVGFYGIGLVVSKDGQIVADRKSITAGNSYIGVLSDGSAVELNPVGVDKKTNFILFKLLKPSTVTVTFTPAILSDTEPRLGQTVISLGGEEQNAVSVGRVESFAVKETTIATSTTKTISAIETNVSTKDLVNGSPLFTLSGSIVGIKLSNEVSRSFTPISVLKKELNQLVEP